MYVISALYQFTHFPDFEKMRTPLLKLCLENGVKGTLLLAHEGINGTIAGTREGIDSIIAFIQSDPRFNNLEYKESFAEQQPFLRMKVKLKKEIVTMGVTDINPLENVGQYVEPEQWDALISDPDTILIDTRNDYEYEIGTFKGAINPDTETFREFPQYVAENLDPNRHKKVAMFCTGGIRCEKATSYMIKLGFENVYHLKGGILKYLENIPAEKSSWEGECFVFDERVAVNHDLEPGQYDQCYACRYPLSKEEMQSPLYKKGVSCPKCHDKVTPQKRARFEERQKQMELARQRNAQHLGQKITKKQG